MRIYPLSDSVFQKSGKKKIPEEKALRSAAEGRKKKKLLIFRQKTCIIRKNGAQTAVFRQKKGVFAMTIRKIRAFLLLCPLFCALCVLCFPFSANAASVPKAALPQRLFSIRAPGAYIAVCRVQTDTGTAYTSSRETAAAALARADSLAREAAEENGFPDEPVRKTDVTFTLSLLPEGERDTLYTEDALCEAFTAREGALSLSYACTRRDTEAVLLPYGTEYRENDKDFDGIHTMISPGENGLACAIYDVASDPFTGEETGRTETSRSVVREPVNAVFYLGRYPLTDLSFCTGSFAWPLPDNEQFLHRDDYPEGKVPLAMTVYLSSLYGERDLWGKYDFHLGLDIAAPYRTPIYACDGGVVVFAHFYASYGLVVRIRHADGIETVYAHQDSTVVHDGDMVEKGQLIGYVGNTGTASGFHLHLEFRRDHVTCDPDEFLTIPENVPIVIW